MSEPRFTAEQFEEAADNYGRHSETQMLLLQAAAQARQLATLRAMRGEMEQVCLHGESVAMHDVLRRLLDALGTEE